MARGDRLYTKDFNRSFNKRPVWNRVVQASLPKGRLVVGEQSTGVQQDGEFE